MILDRFVRVYSITPITTKIDNRVWPASFVTAPERALTIPPAAGKSKDATTVLSRSFPPQVLSNKESPFGLVWFIIQLK
jgi:hypothetical protein